MAEEMHDGLIARLTRLLGDSGVAFDEATRDAAGWDALGSQRGFDDGSHVRPMAVVYPCTPDDVVAIVRVANETGSSVVTRGGGTGLMGAARSTRRGIVIDTKRMARVREIDVTSRIAWVEAGAVLEQVDDALRPHGLMIGHDPWTYGIATIGGTISTNGLGFLGGKYGSMGQQVLGFEAVMADGSIVHTRPVRPKSAGADLSSLIVGGEGQFGIITAAALRVFPLPESRQRVGYRFANFERGFAAILALHALGIAPALLDYGERPAVPDGVGWRGARDAAPPTLFLGFDGLSEEVRALVSRASDICKRHGGSRIDDAAVEEFWDSRHVVADNFAKGRAARAGVTPASGEGRCFDYIHVSLPPSRVLQYRQQACAVAVLHDVHVLEAGVWVSPGLFSLAMANVAPTHEEARVRMSAMVDECLRAAHAAGGSMEYCHGVGMRLAHLMREEHGAGLDVLRHLKRGLDPSGVLNPDKLSLT
ncbi:MAG: FAD-binding oxidoreductase [Dehalococcoidia bacterium]